LSGHSIRSLADDAPPNFVATVATVSGGPIADDVGGRSSFAAPVRSRRRAAGLLSDNCDHALSPGRKRVPDIKLNSQLESTQPLTSTRKEALYNLRKKNNFSL
jgi:hypothetical protein